MPLDDATRDRISSLVADSDVLLFMKGTRDAPQCGFSATVVEILDGLLPDYATFDVLGDPAVRQGVKEFSSWPTVPQLYVRGEFLGGCDIVQELATTGELAEKLGVEPPPPPTLRVSEGAAAALRGLAETREEKHLHLRVNRRFENALYFGPVEPGETAVEAGGVTFYLDPGTARRADGLSIDVVEGAEDPGFRIENPNQPGS